MTERILGILWRKRRDAVMLRPAQGGAGRAGRTGQRGRGDMKHAFLALSLMFALLGCTPTVAVEAPKEPITVNLNIRLDADVRLRVEEQGDLTRIGD